MQPIATPEAIDAATCQVAKRWHWIFATGVAGIVLVAVMVLAWPAATVLVLAVLLGLRVLFQGAATTYFAWSIRRLA